MASITSVRGHLHCTLLAVLIQNNNERVSMGDLKDFNYSFVVQIMPDVRIIFHTI